MSEEIKKAVLKHMAEEIEEMWRESFDSEFKNQHPQLNTYDGTLFYKISYGPTVKFTFIRGPYKLLAPS